MGYRLVSGVVALIGFVLVASPLVSGQSTPPLKMRGYGQLAGCPEEPAKLYPCALARAKTFTPPKTAEGTPDFQGFWNRARVTSDNIEEHAEMYGDPGGVSLIIDPADGRLPYQPWALAQRKVNVDSFISPQAACLLPGVPRQAYTPGGGYQIMQNPGYLTFFLEYGHVYRIIPTDGRRQHLAPGLTLGMGDSIGRWDGKTLVIDVTNLSGKTWYDNEGNFYSTSMHAVERWSMFGPDAMLYEVVMDDPRVYTQPFKMAFGLRRNKEEGYEILEYACHEGDRNLPHRMNLGVKPYLGIDVPN